MRKPIYTILIILLALNHLGAADLIRPIMNLDPTSSGVRVNLDFSRISETQWRDMLEHPHSFHNYGYGVAGGPGDAAIPMLTQLVPIRLSASTSVENVQRNDYLLNDVALKATPQGHLDSDLQAVDVMEYNWQRASRSMLTEILPGEPILLKGQYYLPITIHPVQIDGSSQVISIPTTLQFDLEGIELAQGVQVSSDGGVRSVTPPEAQFASKGHYLIITPAVYADYITYFADWKMRKGYKVTIVTTAVAGSTANTIKNYIQTAWDTWEVRPDYVVLVGDEDRGIPGHYIQNPQGENLVTDHPYGLMEGGDSFPELMVGRLSVDTISELVSFTAKIVAYESSPYMTETDWFQRALMISTNTGAASAQATKQWVAAKLLENGYDQVYTAYHPHVSSTTNISTPINSGVNFVNYRGFGMYNGWYGPDFTSWDINNLIRNGAKTPVITSVVCGGGNFAASNDDPCFGEVWTRIGTFSVPKGAVAFFGPSELHTHTQFNNVIDIGIYSGIFDQGITTLGEALWNGKFELWRNYHQNTFFPFDQTPEFYHHIYNLLGDPGMQLWTATPEYLTVNHVDTLNTGENSTLIFVGDSLGSPIPGAYVSFYNDENARGGYTNEFGEINLPFSASTTGELELTVTGQNLYPYMATLTIVASSETLSLESWTTETDGQIVAGAVSNMFLTLENAGAELNDVEITFSSDTPGIILGETIVVPTIAGNSTYVSDPIGISATHQLSHGSPVMINLVVSTGDMTQNWNKFFAVQAPLIRIEDIVTASGTLAAGDSAQVEIMLINEGGVMSDAMTITPLQHDLITIEGGSSSCPQIDIDDSEMATQSYLLIFDDQIFPAEKLTLQFECVQTSGTDTLEFVLEVGEPNRYGPSQTDAYGYRMFDNWDLAYTKAPTYDWIEIDPNLGGFGTIIPMSDMWEEGDASRVLNLPFPVTYYGETYTQITVCTNGWAAFGNQSVVDFHNRTIPSPIGPVAMLAPFWDDLLTSPGVVSYKNVAAGESFVIEWNHMRNLGEANSLTFQIVLYDTEERPTLSGNNDIKFQYREYDNIDVEGNFSTVGIESPDYDTGILASYNSYNDVSVGNLYSESALLFTTDRGTQMPEAVASVSNNSISFVQNPWTSNQDSIVITNVGESPLAYNIDINSTLDRLPPGPAVSTEGITKTSEPLINNPSSAREGSDEYGYFWKKNTDFGGPVYNWIDIETPENLIVHLGDPDDSSVGPIGLGFDFPFYDDVFNQTFISSNGTISFMGNYAPWLNISLPSVSAPSALIAPWWDDLNNDPGNLPLGSLYFWTNDFDQCIITWKDFPEWGSSDVYTFQVILDSYGKILFQYETMDGDTYSSTVGMQSAGRNAGLTIHYNESTPFEAGTAISIQPPLPWFSATGWSGRVEPGESQAFVVDIQSLSLEPGVYQKPMTLYTSASNHSESDLMVTMEVVYGQPPLGDLDGDYLINLRDLMKMLDFILLLEDMNDDQFSQADISLDAEVNIIDVVLLLEEILDNE